MYDLWNILHTNEDNGIKEINLRNFFNIIQGYYGEIKINSESFNFSHEDIHRIHQHYKRFYLNKYNTKSKVNLDQRSKIFKNIKSYAENLTSADLISLSKRIKISGKVDNVSKNKEAEYEGGKRISPLNCRKANIDKKQIGSKKDTFDFQVNRNKNAQKNVDKNHKKIFSIKIESSKKNLRPFKSKTISMKS